MSESLAGGSVGISAAGFFVRSVTREEGGELMKFLVVATRRDQMPGPPQALAGMLAAQLDWIADRVEEGRIEVVYGFPQGGGIAIADAADADELSTVLMSSPAFWINDWDVRPLADIRTVLTHAAEGLSRAFVGAAA